MQITAKTWNDYVSRLSRLNQKAGQLMQEYITAHGVDDTGALIRYAYALATKYGEGSAELACQMYDALAAAEGALVPAAEPAATASYEEVAKMVNATRSSPSQMQSGVSRLVKQAGADTTLKNAARDGAEWAWIPHGDTCAFCITLASRGWQRQSQKAMNGGHAQHIHANCDCEYAVRFNRSTNVAGYDPKKYLRQYRAAGSDINAMRREHYAANKDEINAQQRAAYAARKLSTEKEKSAIMTIEDKNARQYASTELLKKHYDKHLSEFGNISVDEYLKMANTIADTPPSDDVVQLIRSDGSISKYRFSTNEFVVITSDNKIRTYFKPRNKGDYWDEELERNK